jgi:hypothetical protein
MWKITCHCKDATPIDISYERVKRCDEELRNFLQAVTSNPDRGEMAKDLVAFFAAMAVRAEEARKHYNGFTAMTDQLSAILAPPKDEPQVRPTQATGLA